MIPEEIKALATDTFKEKVFFSTMIREIDQHLLGSIFMPVILMDKPQIDQLEKDKVSAFYEYMNKALPRCINGYPMFSSMRTITVEDLAEVQLMVKKLTDATDNV
jgi:hypothetical protein